jgi:hypothetical protein
MQVGGDFVLGLRSAPLFMDMHVRIGAYEEKRRNELKFPSIKHRNKHMEYDPSLSKYPIPSRYNNNDRSSLVLACWPRV